MESIPCSVLHKGQHVVFAVPPTSQEPGFRLRSAEPIQPHPLDEMRSRDPNQSQVVTELNIQKAEYLKNEARVGKTLVVKINDPLKYKDYLNPEDLCLNLQEKRLELVPQFFWNRYDEHTEDNTWHAFVCVCSSARTEEEQNELVEREAEIQRQKELSRQQQLERLANEKKAREPVRSGQADADKAREEQGHHLGRNTNGIKSDVSNSTTPSVKRIITFARRSTTPNVSVPSRPMQTELTNEINQATQSPHRQNPVSSPTQSSSNQQQLVLTHQSNLPAEIASISLASQSITTTSSDLPPNRQSQPHQPLPPPPSPPPTNHHLQTSNQQSNQRPNQFSINNYLPDQPFPPTSSYSTDQSTPFHTNTNHLIPSTSLESTRATQSIPSSSTHPGPIQASFHPTSAPTNPSPHTDSNSPFLPHNAHFNSPFQNPFASNASYPHPTSNDSQDTNNNTNPMHMQFGESTVNAIEPNPNSSNNNMLTSNNDICPIYYNNNTNNINNPPNPRLNNFNPDPATSLKAAPNLQTPPHLITSNNPHQHTQHTQHTHQTLTQLSIPPQSCYTPSNLPPITTTTTTTTSSNPFDTLTLQPTVLGPRPNPQPLNQFDLLISSKFSIYSTLGRSQYRRRYPGAKNASPLDIDEFLSKQLTSAEKTALQQESLRLHRRLTERYRKQREMNKKNVVKKRKVIIDDSDDDEGPTQPIKPSPPVPDSSFNDLKIEMNSSTNPLNPTPKIRSPTNPTAYITPTLHTANNAEIQTTATNNIASTTAATTPILTTHNPNAKISPSTITTINPAEVPTIFEKYYPAENFNLIEDSPAFKLGPYDHCCGIIILQQFFHTSEYFQVGAPLIGQVSESLPDGEGLVPGLCEVSVFCAKACGSKLLTCLVEYIVQHDLPYKYLITSSTNTAQKWYYQHGFVAFECFRKNPAEYNIPLLSDSDQARAEWLYRHHIPDKELNTDLDEPAHMLYIDIKEQYEMLQRERAKGNKNVVVGHGCEYLRKKAEREARQKEFELKQLQQAQEMQLKLQSFQQSIFKSLANGAGGLANQSADGLVAQFLKPETEEHKKKLEEMQTQWIRTWTQQYNKLHPSTPLQPIQLHHIIVNLNSPPVVHSFMESILSADILQKQMSKHNEEPDLDAVPEHVRAFRRQLALQQQNNPHFVMQAMQQPRMNGYTIDPNFNNNHNNSTMHNGMHMGANTAMPAGLLQQGQIHSQNGFAPQQTQTGFAPDHHHPNSFAPMMNRMYFNPYQGQLNPWGMNQYQMQDGSSDGDGSDEDSEEEEEEEPMLEGGNSTTTTTIATATTTQHTTTTTTTEIPRRILQFRRSIPAASTRPTAQTEQRTPQPPAQSQQPPQ